MKIPEAKANKHYYVRLKHLLLTV